MSIKPLELSPLELERIVSLDEAARLRGVSADTLRRHDRDKFIQLSPRRLGMRVRDALGLGKQSETDFITVAHQRGDFGAVFLRMDGNTGDFKAGKAGKDMNKAHLVAEVPDIMIGHQKITKGQRPLYTIGRIADGFHPLTREELGGPDNDGWEEVSMLIVHRDKPRQPRRHHQRCRCLSRKRRTPSRGR
jgi:hypothetical protein